MDFTREPIVESVITPRDGYKLVVRSSKSAGQEEHFVDSVEVVSFGSAFFFRSIERPKPFLVPVSDYEVLEVREPRMVIKTPQIESSIKIGASRETNKNKIEQERKEPVVQTDSIEKNEPTEDGQKNGSPDTTIRGDRRRDRRRQFRNKKRTNRDEVEGQTDDAVPPAATENKERILSTSGMLTNILPPPTKLIRDELDMMRSNEIYKAAFYSRSDKEEKEEDKEIDISFESFREDAQESGQSEFFREDEFKSSARIQDESRDGADVEEQFEEEKVYAPFEESFSDISEVSSANFSKDEGPVHEETQQ